MKKQVPAPGTQALALATRQSECLPPARSATRSPAAHAFCRPHQSPLSSVAADRTSRRSRGRASPGRSAHLPPESPSPLSPPATQAGPRHRQASDGSCPAAQGWPKVQASLGWRLPEAQASLRWRLPSCPGLPEAQASLRWWLPSRPGPPEAQAPRTRASLLWLAAGTQDLGRLHPGQPQLQGTTVQDPSVDIPQGVLSVAMEVEEAPATALDNPQPRMLPGELSIARSPARWAEGRPATPRCAAAGVQAGGLARRPHTLQRPPRCGPGQGGGTTLRPGLTSTAWPSSRSKPTTHTQCSQAEKPSQRSRPRPSSSSSSSGAAAAAAAASAGASRSSAAAPASSNGPRELGPELSRPRRAIHRPLAVRAASTAERAAERARFCAGAAAAAAAAGDGLRRGETGTHVTLGAQLRAGPPPAPRGLGSQGSAAITTMNDQQLNYVLDLMRHLPPQQIKIDLIDLVPSLSEDLSSVDQTLKIVQEDGGKGLPFV
ncbi:hypothetical protein QTO34_006945 [Cnephaeus nilssonii]|uniref:Uncharacterized protein n=1 Tax=Cnephaeus nilssonii TaxID=3371016 RepID=A0AA40HJG5_CNENI|nr:hypothetical protein QTO34_006945 [Eptesicus nilssonii]